MAIQRVALGFLFIIGLTACGKPTPATLDPAISVIPAATVTAEPVIRKTSGMVEADLILITAKFAGKNPEEITLQAINKIGWGGSQKGKMTAAAILRNLTIAERLGSTTAEDIAEMRKGNAATVRKGPYAGDILSVDHIIPRSVAPSLDNTIANLELMPLRVNRSKGDKIGDRQRDLAIKLHAAGLLENPNLRE